MVKYIVCIRNNWIYWIKCVVEMVKVMIICLKVVKFLLIVEKGRLNLIGKIVFKNMCIFFCGV